MARARIGLREMFCQAERNLNIGRKRADEVNVAEYQTTNRGLSWRTTKAAEGWACGKGFSHLLRQVTVLKAPGQGQGWATLPKVGGRGVISWLVGEAML